MRRGFIHVQMRGEHAQRRVALLERLHVLVKHLPGKLSDLGCGVHVVLVSDLDDEFFKQLFLLARADFPFSLCSTYSMKNLERLRYSW